MSGFSPFISPRAIMRLSRRCLEAVLEHPLLSNLHELNLSGELRLSTLADACDYGPQASRGFSQVHWQDCSDPAKARGTGVFHPASLSQPIEVSDQCTSISVPPRSIAVQNLQELILITEGGLGNRLRAIASAKRLGQLLEIPVTVIWDWGHWQELFEGDSGLNILPSLPDHALKLPIMRTRLFRDGGELLNQQLRLPNEPVCKLKTGHCFSFETLPAVTPNSLADLYPKPSAAVSEIVQNFISQHFLNPTVGVHIRRTDNIQSIQNSPDHLFEVAIDELVKSEHLALICTDNLETLSMLRLRFGNNLLHRPKFNERATRWPRSRVEFEDLRDDWIDLLLLSRCNHVLGSWFSSFSETAIALNQNPSSRCLQVST